MTGLSLVLLPRLQKNRRVLLRYFRFVNESITYIDEERTNLCDIFSSPMPFQFDFSEICHHHHDQTNERREQNPETSFSSSKVLEKRSESAYAILQQP